MNAFTGAAKSNGEICRFFKNGFCKNGPNCPFLHEIDQDMVGSPNIHSPIVGGGNNEGAMGSPSQLGGVEGIIFNSNIQNVRNAAGDTLHNNLRVLGRAPRSASESSSPEIANTVEVNELCTFYMNGSCRYGAKCRNLHGLPCPTCKKNVLHPFDEALRTEHVLSCAPQKEEKAKEVKCGICDKPCNGRRIGLLSDCPHVFCLQCIRNHRNTGNDVNSAGADSIRNCPVCQEASFFIIPSETVPESEEHKGQIIEGYKKKLSTIPCKYFKHGDSPCPFGSACFYGHFTKDGERIVDSDKERKYIYSSNSVEEKKTVTLSDFFSSKTKKK